MQSALDMHAVLKTTTASLAGTIVGIVASTRTARTSTLLLARTKAGGEETPAERPARAPTYVRPQRQEQRQDRPAGEGSGEETSDTSEPTRKESGESQPHSPPSLMESSLRTIVKHIPTSVASDNPFHQRLAHSPGDWLLQALVAHLLEDGLQRMRNGQWCGASRTSIDTLSLNPLSAGR